jgi:hypothetical protein
MSLTWLKEAASLVAEENTRDLKVSIEIDQFGVGVGATADVNEEEGWAWETVKWDDFEAREENPLPAMVKKVAARARNKAA